MLRRLAISAAQFFVRIFSKAKTRKVKRMLGAILCGCLVFCLVVGGMLFSISAAVCNKVQKQVMTVEELENAGETYDCVLVLGCAVYRDGRLSAMLSDRVLTGAELLFAGVSDTLLMSGDHRTDDYNEVGAMKDFAIGQGVPSERIFQDHDGYSTYDSIARLKTVYGAKKVVIVTQEYHLYRALYLAEKLGIDAVGVAADRPEGYNKKLYRNTREILARCKDVYYGLKQPAPEVLSTAVDLSGSGDLTAESRPISE